MFSTIRLLAPLGSFWIPSFKTIFMATYIYLCGFQIHSPTGVFYLEECIPTYYMSAMMLAIFVYFIIY